MKKIPLKQGKYALVDDADYEWLKQYKWAAYKGVRTYYAGRNEKDGTGKFRFINMHRAIMKTPKGLETDHIDGDGLNNQRSNLRVCTAAQNQHNRSPHKNCSSRYKGVSWKKSGKKWVVRIHCNYQSKHVGVFADEVEAARAYDKAAKEAFGEFARLNFSTNYN
jgi:hypothetical protein